MSTKDALTAARTRMEKAVDDFRKEASSLRTGRANAMLLDNVRVDYHGTPMPVNQLGTVTVPDATMLVIAPWDASAVPLIDKAIRTADLGLNPTNDGKVVRVPIPSPTEERRKDMVKLLHKMLENHRTAVRNVRRDSKEAIEKLGERQKNQRRRKKACVRRTREDQPIRNQKNRRPKRPKRTRSNGRLVPDVGQPCSAGRPQLSPAAFDVAFDFDFDFASVAVDLQNRASAFRRFKNSPAQIAPCKSARLRKKRAEGCSILPAIARSGFLQPSRRPSAHSCKAVRIRSLPRSRTKPAGSSTPLRASSLCHAEKSPIGPARPSQV